MFKDVTDPKADEMFKFAVAVVASVFLIVVIAASYEITNLIS